MTRSDSFETDTRKIQEVSGGTYTVSVPKSWATAQSIEAGTTVYVTAHDDGSLVVRKREDDPGPLASARVLLEEPDPGFAELVLEAAYAAGYESVTLTAPTAFSAEQRREITARIRELAGLNVVAESEEEITARGLLNAADVSVRQSVTHLRYVALSTHREAIAALGGDEARVDSVIRQRGDADRTAALIARHFARSLSEFEEVDRLGRSRAELFAYYRTAGELDRVADLAVRIARAADRLDRPLTDEQIEPVRSVGAATRDLVEDATEAVVDGASLDRVREITASYDRLAGESGLADGGDLDALAEADPYACARVEDCLARTAERGRAIAETAIQASLRES